MLLLLPFQICTPSCICSSSSDFDLDFDLVYFFFRVCICVVCGVHSVDEIVIHFSFRRQQNPNDIERLKRYRYEYDIEKPSPHDSVVFYVSPLLCPQLANFH